MLKNVTREIWFGESFIPAIWEQLYFLRLVCLSLPTDFSSIVLVVHHICSPITVTSDKATFCHSSTWISVAMAMAISWPRSFKKWNIISVISDFLWSIQEVSQNERKAMNLTDNESDSLFTVLSCRQNYWLLVNLKEAAWRSLLVW